MYFSINVEKQRKNQSTTKDFTNDKLPEFGSNFLNVFLKDL